MLNVESTKLANSQHLRKEGNHFIKHYSQNYGDGNFYRIYNLNSSDKLVSKLVIKRLKSDYKTVYKCKCDDGSEARYTIELENKG